jgi:hypothetical protein
VKALSRPKRPEASARPSAVSTGVQVRTNVSQVRSQTVSEGARKGHDLPTITIDGTPSRDG